MSKPPSSALAICLAATIALAVAMGVGRFAFTPLLPLMLRDGVLRAADSPFLAASNYLGYLAGALSANRLGLKPTRMMGIALLGIAALTIAMGLADSLPIWLALRGAAGVLSAWALVGTSGWALFQLARLERPRLAGIVYAGVGIGIALAGMFCLIAAAPGVASAELWRELGLLALALAALPLALARGGPAAPRLAGAAPSSTARGAMPLIVCYGVFGFGYILPATFLPALARQMVDDPRLFGLAWPVFGAAAALSTLLAGMRLVQRNRLRAWAICHVAMALGALLPSLWLSPLTLTVAALLVGGTFMIVTMLGMQEARARAPTQADVGAALGRMTAAFALGQLAGPLALLAAPSGALNPALQAAALALVLTAVPLWRLSRGGREVL